MFSDLFTLLWWVLNVNSFQCLFFFLVRTSFTVYLFTRSWNQLRMCFSISASPTSPSISYWYWLVKYRTNFWRRVWLFTYSLELFRMVFVSSGILFCSIPSWNWIKFDKKFHSDGWEQAFCCIGSLSEPEHRYKHFTFQQHKRALFVHLLCKYSQSTITMLSSLQVHFYKLGWIWILDELPRAQLSLDQMP